MKLIKSKRPDARSASRAAQSRGKDRRESPPPQGSGGRRRQESPPPHRGMHYVEGRDDEPPTSPPPAVPVRRNRSAATVATAKMSNSRGGRFASASLNLRADARQRRSRSRGKSQTRGGSKEPPSDGRQRPPQGKPQGRSQSRSRSRSQGRSQSRSRSQSQGRSQSRPRSQSQSRSRSREDPRNRERRPPPQSPMGSRPRSQSQGQSGNRSQGKSDHRAQPHPQSRSRSKGGQPQSGPRPRSWSKSRGSGRPSSRPNDRLQSRSPHGSNPPRKRKGKGPDANFTSPPEEDPAKREQEEREERNLMKAASALAAAPVAPRGGNAGAATDPAARSTTHDESAKATLTPQPSGAGGWMDGWDGFWSSWGGGGNAYFATTNAVSTPTEMHATAPPATPETPPTSPSEDHTNKYPWSPAPSAAKVDDATKTAPTMASTSPAVGDPETGSGIDNPDTSDPKPVAHVLGDDLESTPSAPTSPHVLGDDLESAPSMDGAPSARASTHASTAPSMANATTSTGHLTRMGVEIDLAHFRSFQDTVTATEEEEDAPWPAAALALASSSASRSKSGPSWGSDGAYTTLVETESVEESAYSAASTSIEGSYDSDNLKSPVQSPPRKRSFPRRAVPSTWLEWSLKKQIEAETSGSNSAIEAADYAIARLGSRTGRLTPSSGAASRAMSKATSGLSVMTEPPPSKYSSPSEAGGMVEAALGGPDEDLPASISRPMDALEDAKPTKAPTDPLDARHGEARCVPHKTPAPDLPPVPSSECHGPIKEVDVADGSGGNGGGGRSGDGGSGGGGGDGGCDDETYDDGISRITFGTKFTRSTGGSLASLILRRFLGHKKGQEDIGQGGQEGHVKGRVYGEEIAGDKDLEEKTKNGEAEGGADAERGEVQEDAAADARAADVAAEGPNCKGADAPAAGPEMGQRSTATNAAWEENRKEAGKEAQSKKFRRDHRNQRILAFVTAIAVGLLAGYFIKGSSDRGAKAPTGAIETPDASDAVPEVDIGANGNTAVDADEGTDDGDRADQATDTLPKVGTNTDATIVAAAAASSASSRDDGISSGGGVAAWDEATPSLIAHDASLDLAMSMAADFVDAPERDPGGLGVVASTTITLTASTASTADLPSEGPTRRPTGEFTARPTGGLAMHLMGEPTERPTEEPSEHPTGEPTARPSGEPTEQPTGGPTEHPTGKTTERPTREPRARPTWKPTSYPSWEPTARPTEEPTTHPTEEPTKISTEEPTNRSTKVPTVLPTGAPTFSPSYEPTFQPTDVPTSSPIVEPAPPKSASEALGALPLENPTFKPTLKPTESPSKMPVRAPSKSPTTEPTEPPSMTPSAMPSVAPTNLPTNSPSKEPTSKPSMSPTNDPTESPSRGPTLMPSVNPTSKPTLYPSKAPTSKPSASPTNYPSKTPTLKPSASPTIDPTESPSDGPTLMPSLKPITPPPVQSFYCTSDPQFRDGLGRSCNWYRLPHVGYRCATADTKGWMNDDGRTPWEACCFCGGGTWSKYTIQSPPVPPPAPPPTPPPTPLIRRRLGSPN
ncbi:hypothetical protein ACHAWF_012988 [Thalassiosira exigua]